MFYTVDAKSGVSSSDNSTIDVMTQHAASVTVYSVVVTLLIVLTAVIIPATVSCTWRYSLGTCESFFSSESNLEPNRPYTTQAVTQPNGLQACRTACYRPIIC